jgi:hypothetical protein
LNKGDLASFAELRNGATSVSVSVIVAGEVELAAWRVESQMAPLAAHAFSQIAPSRRTTG